MYTQTVVYTAMHAPLRAVGISWLGLLASTYVCLVYTVPTLLLTPCIDAASKALPACAWWNNTVAYQDITFAVSGALLVLAAWALGNADTRHCPPDPDQARAYRRLRHWNRWVVKASVVLWLLGISAAYIAAPLPA